MLWNQSKSSGIIWSNVLSMIYCVWIIINSRTITTSKSMKICSKLSSLGISPSKKMKPMISTPLSLILNKNTLDISTPSLSSYWRVGLSFSREDKPILTYFYPTLKVPISITVPTMREISNISTKWLNSMSAKWLKIKIKLKPFSFRIRNTWFLASMTRKIDI